MDGTIRKEGCVFFYGSIFSNFYTSLFTIDGIEYWCGEQWMMAEKARLFGDPEMLKKILEEKKNPLTIKMEYGRNVKNFSDPKWKEVARDLVYVGLLEKFKQNPHMKKFLLDTGEDTIVEASPTDKLWGIGIGMEKPSRLSGDKSTWKGTNWLGEVLMRVRETIKAE